MVTIDGGVLKKVTDDDIKNGQFTIPEGVTVIGDSAFCEGSSLTSVVIPEDVTTIRFEAFAACNLTSIVIPKSVTEIGEGAFTFCKNLASVVIQEGVVAIKKEAFRKCEKLTSVIIPESVTTIEKKAFFYCRSLTSIIIPKGVLVIGDDVFCECNNLTSIVISENVIKIGEDVFDQDQYDTLTIHIDTDSKENYERILKLFPEEGQEKIQADNRSFVQSFMKRAMILMAGANQDQGHTFFNKHELPSEVTTQVLAKLAQEYKIPSFMIIDALKELASMKDNAPENNTFKK